MAERGFRTEFWENDFVQDLPPEGKLLLAYLSTNGHCNQAGLYEITLKTIAFDTGLAQDSLPALLERLKPLVAWYPTQKLIWLKSFLKEQCKSQSFLIAAVKSLMALRNNGLVEEFIVYNQEFDIRTIWESKRDTVLPQCQHGGTGVVSPSDTAAKAAAATDSGVGDNRGVVKGGKKGERKGERKKGEADSVVAEIFAQMRSILGFPEKTDKDPIPNYAKEGSFIKKMLGRHFTRDDILSCWESKMKQRRGGFVSMAWVNDDIADWVARREKGDIGGRTGRSKGHPASGTPRSDQDNKQLPEPGTGGGFQPIVEYIDTGED